MLILLLCVTSCGFPIQSQKLHGRCNFKVSTRDLLTSPPAVVKMFARTKGRRKKPRTRKKLALENDPSPCKKTVSFLAKHTRFDEDEITEWFRWTSSL